MDILKAEIAKKRKQLEDHKLLSSNKKYFKRGELLAKEEEEYKQKHGRKNSVDDMNSDRIPLGETNDPNMDSHSLLPRSEVILRLRDFSEPILLFGESEIEAFKRLRQCELLEPEVNKGFRNDFQEAMEQVDQAYFEEMVAMSEEAKMDDNTVTSASTTSTTTSSSLNEKTGEATTLNYEEIRTMSKRMGKGNRDHDMTVIVHFIQLLLRMWQDRLQNRSAADKRDTKGKLAGATYTQTTEYLKPLLRKLKSLTLPEDISDSLTEIVVHLLNRNYLKASDAYLQMAIGNAPWPIGVTMVGIHARTGREKIFSKNVAHVMNDETQRKYIQGLKRLMTKCQEYFPTDPSRCVEYAPPPTETKHDPQHQQNEEKK